MSILNDLSEYLIEKVESHYYNSNTGVMMLKLYPSHIEDMERMVLLSIQTMQSLFTKESIDSPAGESSLTNMSMKVGQHLFRFMKREPITWEHEIRLGDLFIEAFYNLGLINIDYPARRDSPHMVRISDSWTLLSRIPDSCFDITLQATSTTFIPQITKPIQNGKPIVKDSMKPIDINAKYIKAINKLQQTGWKINSKVFEALMKENGFTSTKREKNKARDLKRQSKLIEWKFIKAKAKLLLDTEFYQYMSADYRGRLYYDEPFLNFQGSDLSRGILLFTEGKPIDESGNFWLAVHTANSYNQSYNIDEIPDWVTADYRAHLEREKLESISVDKFTLEDRATWTQQNIDWIIEMGEECRFDKDAEKPVTFLAACVEWYEYNSNPNHISYLPIGIDGSNNGWQHLGAISKDPLTGQLVGLIPVDIQQDFYVKTAKELINQTTDEDLIKILESMPMKKIRKGISKRGSMTRAYSAGAGKIAENMYFDCKVEDYHEDYGITQADCNKFARLLIQAIDTVCPGPLQTMAYFQALAAFEIGKYGIDPKLIARRKELNRLKDPTTEDLEELNDICIQLEEQNEDLTYGNGKKALTWTTPSGFNVEYTSWIMTKLRCLGSIHGYRRVNHVIQKASDKPDVRGYMCGISPNFIHSMDASHMALVIDDWSNTFGAVHDSFSTHACDVEELLSLTKEKFIEMYDVDNFYDYIENQIITDKDGLDVEQPQRGSLEIKEIENSDYFFA